MRRELPCTAVNTLLAARTTRTAQFSRGLFCICVCVSACRDPVTFHVGSSNFTCDGRSAFGVFRGFFCIDPVLISEIFFDFIYYANRGST